MVIEDSLCHQSIDVRAEFPHRVGRVSNAARSSAGQFILENLFGPSSSDFDRNPDDDILESILPFAEHRTGQTCFWSL